jgi:hypothetical protein
VGREVLRLLFMSLLEPAAAAARLAGRVEEGGDCVFGPVLFSDGCPDSAG